MIIISVWNTSSILFQENKFKYLQHSRAKVYFALALTIHGIQPEACKGPQSVRFTWNICCRHIVHFGNNRTGQKDKCIGKGPTLSVWSFEHNVEADKIFFPISHQRDLQHHLLPRYGCIKSEIQGTYSKVLKSFLIYLKNWNR